MRLSIKSFKYYFLNVLTILLVIISVFPILWIFLTAVKTEVQAFSMPPVWFFKPTFNNFIEVIKSGDFLNAYKNSLIVTLGTIIASLTLGVMSGYALAKATFKGNRAMGMWILIVRMSPPMGFALSLYIMFRKLGLLDTYLGLILVYMTITLPFVTWIMMGFFKGIPKEIEEAARIDGASRFKILVNIYIPIGLPGIVTCTIFTFIMSWNQFFYALIISGRNTRTTPVIIQGFITFEGINWGQLSAAGILVTLPLLIFSLLVQKGLIRGIAGGALK